MAALGQKATFDTDVGERLSAATTGNSDPRNVCPKADVPTGPASRLLPTQIASANIAEGLKGIGMAERLRSGAALNYWGNSIVGLAGPHAISESLPLSVATLRSSGSSVAVY
jgi:hypothetical protein